MPYCDSICPNDAITGIDALSTRGGTRVGNCAYAFCYTRRTNHSAEPDWGLFRIPEDWLEWNRQFHNNLHLSRQELEKVKDGEGEWDTEYAKVVNAALPFDDCSVHAGEEGWGREGVSFGDLQMRVYLSELSRTELKKRISELGFAAAKTVRRKSDATITEDQTEGWDRIAITYRLWYGDYGGTAQVEFYLSTHHAYTAALVFMHARGAGREESIQQILKSFSWREP